MKKIRTDFALLFIALSFIIVSCSDSSNPSKSYERYLYFPISESDGATAAQAGLYAYRFSSNYNLKDIATKSVIYTTGVGKNGIVVFEYLNAQQKLWGKCEDGSLISVPFPDAGDSNHEYIFAMPPRIALGYNGHNVAYLVKYKLLGDEDPRNAIPRLILFDCAQWKMSIIGLQGILNYMTTAGANVFEPFGENILINEDGSRIWFVLKGMFYDGGDYADIGYAIVECNNGYVSPRSALMNKPLELVGLDLTTKSIVYKFGADTQKEILIMSNNGDIDYLSLTELNLSNPNQFANDISAMAIWTNNGIGIYNPIQKNLISEVISWAQIDNAYPGYLHQENKRLSISPDGEFIAFALPKNTNPNNYGLFKVKKDGTELALIIEDTPVGIPVISPKLEVK